MASAAYSPDDLAVAAQLARSDFYFFARWMFLQRRGYKWMRAPHHKIICDALTRVFEGKCKRLIINIPPRYSKTELAVVNWVAWCLGHTPDAEFIHTSYSSQLATNNSWQVREMLQSSEYQAIFDTRIRSDSAAKHEWRTIDGGIMYATGAGGTITGYGAGKHRDSFGGAILMDDMHKADEARSDVVRSGVIDWFQTTLESRKNSPNTPIVLIMQRLHQDDLAGWLLRGGNGEEWEHICLPAIQEDGSALWPDKHSIDDLRRMQETAPHTFAGQYMQSPSAAEGNIFRPDKIEIVDAIPAGTRFVRGWDLAATVAVVGKDPDYTCGGKLGIAPGGRWIIGDITKLRGAPDAVEAAILNAARRDGSTTRISLPQDPGQAGKAQVAYLTKQLSGFSVSSSPESGDKVTRAEPFAAQVNVGNVMMLRAEWNDSLISEMRMFPNGSHDDQVDSLSRAFTALNINSFGVLDYFESIEKAS